MGRWIEVKDKEGNILAEMTPHPLILCTKYLPKPIQTSFPILDRLELDSKYWTDEFQIIDANESSQLLSEIRRLRNITLFKFFMEGVDNLKFYELWRNGEEESEFNLHLDSLENLIKVAIDRNLCIRIEL